MSRREPAADESGGSILNELTAVIGGHLDHVALMQHVVVGHDDRAAQHLHPELKPRKPGPGKVSSASALRIKASGCRGHELKLTAPGLLLSSSQIDPCARSLRDVGRSRLTRAMPSSSWTSAVRASPLRA